MRHAHTVGATRSNSSDGASANRRTTKAADDLALNPLDGPVARRARADANAPSTGFAQLPLKDLVKAMRLPPRTAAALAATHKAGRNAFPPPERSHKKTVFKAFERACTLLDNASRGPFKGLMSHIKIQIQPPSRMDAERGPLEVHVWPTRRDAKGNATVDARYYVSLDLGGRTANGRAFVMMREGSGGDTTIYKHTLKEQMDWIQAPFTSSQHHSTTQIREAAPVYYAPLGDMRLMQPQQFVTFGIRDQFGTLSRLRRAACVWDAMDTFLSPDGVLNFDIAVEFTQKLASLPAAVRAEWGSVVGSVKAVLEPVTNGGQVSVSVRP
jgi:hypothetical protein